MVDTKRDFIEITPEKIELLQNWSTRFHKHFSEVMKAYGEDEKELFYKLIEFAYSITITIGVIAGFGFAGLGYVKNIVLFIVGEALLFGSIVYTINKIKIIYSKNLTNIGNSRNRKFRVYEKKSMLFRVFLPKFASSRKIKVESFQKFNKKIQNADKKILEEFSQRCDEKTEDESSFLNYIIFLLVVGGGFILLSLFIPCC